MYNEKPQIKLYKYENNAFVLQAIIDDYQEVSFERNKYEAGQFTISINWNIPNSQLFEKNLFVQFGNDSKDFGFITSITDSIAEDGKASQIRSITGYDCRMLFKRRVIKSLNTENAWEMTANGEEVMRKLIQDQCGVNAEEKRKLPITNTLPETYLGNQFTVSESFSNLYDVLVTIATQSEIMWFVEFASNTLQLKVYAGEDKHLTVRFDTDYNSLGNANLQDDNSSYCNAVYIGGKGSGSNRDLYEGETDNPTGLDRFESFSNQNNLEDDTQYQNASESILNQFNQTLTLGGAGLAKSPYMYKTDYDVGDLITVKFNNKSVVTQIMSVTEHWSKGAYNLDFQFGKPVQDLTRQLNVILNKLQSYQATAQDVKKDNVRYYTIPTDTQMPSDDVVCNPIGFIGDVGNGATFKLYFDNQSKTGAKTYHIYLKQLTGSGKLTLTTGVAGANDLQISSGTYVTIVYVDENGNVLSQGATDIIASGNTLPATSSGVASALSSKVNTDADCWYKYYGSPSGTTRYFTIQTNITYAGIIITTGYNGNIYFDANKGNAYSFGSSTSYGVTGYAWSSDGKTLYVKVSGWRPIAVTIPSIRKSENGTSVTASNWSTTAPEGITFSTTVNQIDTAGNRNTAITNAINNLDVSSVGGSGKYISAISETDGKISATAGTIDSSPTNNSNNPVSSGGVFTALNTIGNVFQISGTMLDINDCYKNEQINATIFYNILQIDNPIPNSPLSDKYNWNVVTFQILYSLNLRLIQIAIPQTGGNTNFLNRIFCRQGYKNYYQNVVWGAWVER